MHRVCANLHYIILFSNLFLETTLSFKFPKCLGCLRSSDVSNRSPTRSDAGAEHNHTLLESSNPSVSSAVPGSNDLVLVTPFTPLHRASQVPENTEGHEVVLIQNPDSSLQRAVRTDFTSNNHTSHTLHSSRRPVVIVMNHDSSILGLGVQSGESSDNPENARLLRIRSAVFQSRASHSQRQISSSRNYPVENRTLNNTNGNHRASAPEILMRHSDSDINPLTGQLSRVDFQNRRARTS